MTTTSRLQHEIKQRVPFRTRRQEAAVGLLRTADVVRRRFASLVEPHDLTFQQYNVLRILRGAGENGLPTLEIAARMIEAAPGITRLLDRLEAKGLVHRERCPEDRRQVLCTATPSALRLLARLDAPVFEADAAATAALTESETATLIRLLDRVRAAHAAGDGTPPEEE